MNNLDDLSAVLDGMISSQKEKKQKTYVARYKGKNLVMKSGKSSWKAVNHAKSAITQNFAQEERNYHGFDRDWREKQKKFRAKLWELIEIVELE